MIGDILRRERERQGLSIQDIEKGTSIRKVYIEAIEAGDYQTLPAEVYAKGFVRNYANFLHLNPDECVKQYRDEFSLQDTGMVEIPEEKKDAFFATGTDYHKRIEQPHQRQNLALIALMVGIVLVGGWMAFGNSAEKEHPDADKKSTVNVAATQAREQKPAKDAAPQSAAAAPNPAQRSAASGPVQNPAAPAAPGSTAAANGDIDLQAQFTDRCWMQVIADGAVVYEGTAEAGETMSWKAKDNISITAGNAGAVNITQNGKLLGNPGDYGAVVEKSYTKAMP